MKDDLILQCLLVLAAVRPGNKISLRHGIFEIDTNPSPFWRWLSCDNRVTTFVMITEVVNAAVMSSNTAVHEALFRIPDGLENLKMTYAKDRTMGAALDNLCERIKKFAH